MPLPRITADQESPFAPSSDRSSLRWFVHAAVCMFALGCLGIGSNESQGQSVCLPLPRLLSTMPMGGKVGTSFEISITGENLDSAQELVFSRPGISAVARKDGDDRIVPNQYVLTIAPDCELGLVEARVTSRLGISSARIFSIGNLSEVIQQPSNTALSSAMALPMNSVCNGTVAAKSVDHYAFEAQAGHRYVIHCSSRGIDSKLDPVVIVADANGRDLLVERRGDTLDFIAPADGRHIIKVHELTFKGGPGFFYRLTLQEIAADSPVPTFPATRLVSAFSWPPNGADANATSDGANATSVGANATTQEDEANEVQLVALPCDISGRFYPAADVDTYEFTAAQGDVWWIEVASERLGRPTDPSLVVQKKQSGDAGWVDVVEMTDIPSPIKPSSNGYAYDGPPFDGGSTDLMGKLEISEAGTYRILLSDLFGGTRSDSRNRYRLIVRQAAPDFALAAWGLHMELRNGDRNALSKPLALRPGTTVALEVVSMRRDGFDGEIELTMDGLPNGVTATGLKIPAGKNRGIVLVTAAEDAVQGLAHASLVGTATLNGQRVVRPVQMAQMSWPIVDSWSEIPSPRLVDGLPVSVTVSESAPLTIAATEKKCYEARVGEPLNIPLAHTRRSEFSGSILQLKTLGVGLDTNPAFDVSLDAQHSTGVVSLAAMKVPPGEYTLAFYGTVVARYRENLPIPTGATPPAPRDIAEIMISEPITIRVLP